MFSRSTRNAPGGCAAQVLRERDRLRLAPGEVAVEGVVRAEPAEQVDLLVVVVVPREVDARTRKHGARWKRPQATPEDFAHALERGGLPMTAPQRLRDAADLI